MQIERGSTQIYIINSRRQYIGILQAITYAKFQKNILLRILSMVTIIRIIKKKILEAL